MQDIFYKIEKIAPTDANILILGENGTGKDLIAKAIHQQSLRADKPFVKVDVGALTETFLKANCSGIKKEHLPMPAKTGWAGLKLPRAARCSWMRSEIFRLHQQAKLLSVLQNRQVTRLGTNQAVPIDIRLICATNVPLTELANENRFRKDLIYRINTVEIMCRLAQTRRMILFCWQNISARSIAINI